MMLNSAMFGKVSELSENIDFRECVPLSEQKEGQAYRQELVLRFFCQVAFSGTITELPLEYGEYLTRWMRDASQSYGAEDSSIDVALFQRTFKLLNDQLGEDAFRRFNGTKSLGPFSIASFEFVTSGVSANIDLWEGNAERLAQRVRSVWSAPEFRENSGTGVSPRRRVPRLILNSRRYFSSVD
ncbi:hypothetical protein R2F25_13100 [Streptomyces sp. UP1A-1]|nr:hypothetical protein [Streptomyces sp. UP1A-1]